MYEIVFSNNNNLSYNTDILVINDKIDLCLDTGAPITIICIPYLLKITNENYSDVVSKIDDYLNDHKALELYSYGNDISSESKSAVFNSRKFIPYFIKGCNIGGVEFEYFLFWVDITNYKSKKRRITTALFGMDYISQGKKFFDDNDSFHIIFKNLPLFDLKDLEYALTNSRVSINRIIKRDEIIAMLGY